MLRLYRETPEFGGYHSFDTVTGELKALDMQTYAALREKTPDAHCFSGNSNTHTAFFRRAYMQITRKCNLLCDHCFIKADAAQPDLDADVVFRLAEYLGKNGMMEVRLSGGEPTIAPQFIPIVEAFWKHNVYVSVGTNGLWPAEVLSFFKGQRHMWLIVSIEGDASTHDAIRPHSYARILENLRALRKANPNIRLRINTVLCRRNRHCLEHLAQLTKEFGAQSVVLIPLRAQVRKAAYLENMLSGRGFREAVLEMAEYKARYGIEFSTTVKHYAKEHIVMDKVFTKTSSCAAGREGTNIDFDAARKKLLLYGCSYCPASDPHAPVALRAPFTAGEVDYDDLPAIRTIWEDDARWALFRDLSHKSEDCRSCAYFPGHCEGSCPTLNYDVTQLDLSADVAAQLKRQLQKNGEWYCYRDLGL